MIKNLKAIVLGTAIAGAVALTSLTSGCVTVVEPYPYYPYPYYGPVIVPGPVIIPYHHPGPHHPPYMPRMHPRPHR